MTTRVYQYVRLLRNKDSSDLLHYFTHKLKPVLAELFCEQEGAQNGEPNTPAQHIWYLLHIHHAKDKDELVEDKVPELVPHVLVLQVVELAKDEGVQESGDEEETAAGHVQDRLHGRE